jgi:hypothetical protein
VLHSSVAPWLHDSKDHASCAPHVRNYAPTLELTVLLIEATVVVLVPYLDIASRYHYVGIDTLGTGESTKAA